MIISSQGLLHFTRGGIGNNRSTKSVDFKNEMSLPPPVNYSSHREDGCEKSRSTFGPVWWSGGMLRYTYSNNNNIMIIILWLSESRKEMQGGEGGYGDTTISWLAQT